MTDRKGQLDSWLKRIGPKYHLKLESMTRASSDASFRSYFRILSDEGSYIVMDSPPPMEDVSPFIKVDLLMQKAGLNVPRIFEEDRANGFLLLSDLGTKTYLDVLSKDNAPRLMSDATDALVKFQKASQEGVLPPYSEKLLRTELELFPEWYVKKHLGWEISKEDRSMFDKMFDLIIKKNLDQPMVYVHRDYMPRNLMLTEENNPGILDFQDAVYGPISYDIACLFRDAFISWTEPEVLDWTIRYWEKARRVGLPVREDFGAFWEDVEWMAIQRHLKVLGIFARINYRDGKPKYLGDTPRFIGYVKTVAGRFDALKPIARYFDRITNTEQKAGYTF